MLGQKSFLFSLSVADTTKADYGVTLTNVAGSMTVPEIAVTGRGTYAHSRLQQLKLQPFWRKFPLFPDQHADSL